MQLVWTIRTAFVLFACDKQKYSAGFVKFVRFVFSKEHCINIFFLIFL